MLDLYLELNNILNDGDELYSPYDIMEIMSLFYFDESESV